MYCRSYLNALQVFSHKPSIGLNERMMTVVYQIYQTDTQMYLCVVNVEISLDKSKYVSARGQGIIIHSFGTINSCTKYHSNLSDIRPLESKIIYRILISSSVHLTYISIVLCSVLGKKRLFSYTEQATFKLSTV